jgi:hypothetical protein
LGCRKLYVRKHVDHDYKTVHFIMYNFRFQALAILYVEVVQHFSIHCRLHLQGEWGGGRNGLVHSLTLGVRMGVVKHGAIEWEGAK